MREAVSCSDAILSADQNSYSLSIEAIRSICGDLWSSDVWISLNDTSRSQDSSSNPLQQSYNCEPVVGVPDKLSFKCQVRELSWDLMPEAIPSKYLINQSTYWEPWVILSGMLENSMEQPK